MMNMTKQMLYRIVVETYVKDMVSVLTAVQHFGNSG